MTAHPACCAAFEYHCPLPLPIVGSAFAGCAFDPALLTADDFSGSGIAKPAAIERSVAKRQAEFLAGRLCAQQALAQLGVTHQGIPIGEDRAPVWPAGVSGAITHGQGWAAAIVAPLQACRGLGLDVETVLAPERAQRLAGEILTPAELERLPSSAERSALAVTLTFSLKESLFKALYPLVRRRFYFEAAELLEWSDNGQARLRLLEDLSEEWTRGNELNGQFQVTHDRLLSLVSIAGRRDER